MINKKRNISPVIIASLILATGIVVSVGLFVSQRRNEAVKEQSIRNQFELCLSEADSWYSHNVKALPQVCDQLDASESDCSKLLESTIKGRDKRREECRERYSN